MNSWSILQYQSLMIMAFVVSLFQFVTMYMCAVMIDISAVVDTKESEKLLHNSLSNFTTQIVDYSRTKLQEDFSSRKKLLKAKKKESDPTPDLVGDFFIFFSGTYMDKLHNNFTAISPIGLAHILTVLSKIVDKKSPTSNEIFRALGPLALNPLYFFKEYNKDLMQLEVTSLLLVFNSILTKTSMPIELQTILSETGTSFYSNPGKLIQDIQQLHQGLIQNVNWQINPNSTLFFNFFTLQLQWFRKWHVAPRQIFAQGETKKLVPFLSSKGWMMTASQAGHYQAFRLDLLNPLTHPNPLDTVNLDLDVNGNSPYRNEKIAVYLIQMHLNKKFTRNVLKHVHFNMVKSKPQLIEFYFPRFRLSQLIQFSKEEFPLLMEFQNSDFSLFQSQLRLQLLQETHMCADETANTGKSINEPKMVFSTIFRTVVLNTDFYVVIVNPQYGDPLAIGSVGISEVMDENDSCKY